MIKSMIDYMMCYSTAFVIGFWAGAGVIYIALTEKDKRTQWRRKHGNKTVQR